VETNDYNSAKKLCTAGVDGIQFDKIPAAALKDIVEKLKNEFPKVVLLAAGGITEKNAAEYAWLNIDGIVTTSLFSAKPVDIGVKIKVL
jgi:molybdenum transport protein